MSRTGIVRAKWNTNHVGPLLLSFHKVRILNYMAAGPLCAADIVGHLRRRGNASDRASVNRLLTRLARAGWIKAAHIPSDQNISPSWLITRKGRTVLTQSRQSLNDLHKTLRQNLKNP